MSWEASLAGLKISESPDSWEPIGVSKSMTTIWSIVECLPIKRLTYHNYIPIEGRSFTWRPHFFARRHILPHQRIHLSVYEECDQFDAPDDVEDEVDAYLVLRPQDEVVRSGRILSPQSRTSLQKLSSSENGIRSLCSLQITQYIYDVARLCRDKPSIRGQIFKDLLELHAAFVRGSFKIYQDQNGADATEITSSTVFPFHMCGHTVTISSVAFLSNKRVISGSWDTTLRVWDVGTGEMTLGNPLRSHTGPINCVAVHAAQGVVASASDDSTIRLWTSDENGAVCAEKILQDKSRVQVLAVAFSPDGSHLVSGSEDGTIRLWNAATGERVGEPVTGHENWVRSAAFSWDGKRIVSCCSGGILRLWGWSPDEGSLRLCGEPLRGHPTGVTSVAFSPDARVFASGSADKTVRIWDVDICTSKFTLEGHTDFVQSVAFAPSGTHVASGSDDWTVRIWDARTGAAVRVLRGHTDDVRSVAFSPDGRRIASGSWDSTVRVWDFVPPPDESHAHEDVQAAPAQIEPA